MFMRTYNEILTISMSSTMSSTLNPNLRMTQIGIRCSGTKKCSQRHQIDYFCICIFSSIQPPQIPLEIPPELPANIFLEIRLEILADIPLEMHLEIPLKIPAAK